MARLVVKLFFYALSKKQNTNNIVTNEICHLQLSEEFKTIALWTT